MVIILLLCDIVFIKKYRLAYFNVNKHRAEFYLSMVMVILMTGIHEIHEVAAGSLYQIKGGFPFAWFDKRLGFDELFQPINYLDISSAAYRLDIFFVNLLLIYWFIVGILTVIRNRTKKNSLELSDGAK